MREGSVKVTVPQARAWVPARMGTAFSELLGFVHFSVQVVQLPLHEAPGVLDPLVVGLGGQDAEEMVENLFRPESAQVLIELLLEEPL